jgi:hypothetical protein
VTSSDARAVPGWPRSWLQEARETVRDWPSWNQSSFGETVAGTALLAAVGAFTLLGVLQQIAAEQIWGPAAAELSGWSGAAFVWIFAAFAHPPFAFAFVALWAVLTVLWLPLPPVWGLGERWAVTMFGVMIALIWGVAAGVIASHGGSGSLPVRATLQVLDLQPRVVALHGGRTASGRLVPAGRYLAVRGPGDAVWLAPESRSAGAGGPVSVPAAEFAALR